MFSKKNFRVAKGKQDLLACEDCLYVALSLNYAFRFLRSKRKNT